MNYHLFFGLILLLCQCYWVPYPYIWTFAEILRTLKYFNPKLESTYWKIVTVHRFIRPIRKFMWFLYAISYHINEHKFSYLVYLSFITTFILAFIVKDTHGDDPRQKKPSKVLSAIKSIGHRLVVVPSH